MGHGWRRAAVGVALLAAVPLAIAMSSNAVATPAAAERPCDGDTGVTVVVDFGTLGGGVQTRCAPEPVSTGFEALTQAGFSFEGTVRFPGLLCRIDGKPSVAQDPCKNAPSPKYYWAYWTASSPGGAWTYSDAGAGNRDPAAGSVEGWAFSDGCTRKPGASTTCPGATTTSTASPSTTQAALPGGTATTMSHTTTTTAGGSGQAAVSSSEAGGAASTDAGDAPRSSDDGREQGRDGAALARGDAASDPSSSGGGSPAGALTGAAAAGVLGLAAAGRLRQRRRSSLAGPEAE